VNSGQKNLGTIGKPRLVLLNHHNFKHTLPLPPSAHYNLSFTAASLRPELARIVAESRLRTGDWKSAKKEILAANALQCRSASSANRLERELRQRLERLTQDQLCLLATATSDDRAAMAWLAACKHIPLVFDFAAQVLREKLAAHDPVLRLSDYEGFLDHQSASHPELAALAATSKSKIRQVLRLMLIEVGLLVDGTALGTIQRPVLSPAVMQAITSDNLRWLAGFLVPDPEIARF
jgi:hypothetical protein